MLIPKKKRVRNAQKCNICGKYRVNVWRHKTDVHDIKGSTKRTDNILTSERGYIVKQCPVNKCDAVVERLKDHLVRTHKINKDSVQIKRLLKRAIPVKEDSTEQNKVTTKTDKTRTVKTEKTSTIKTETVTISRDDDYDKQVSSDGEQELDNQNLTGISDVEQSDSLEDEQSSEEYSPSETTEEEEIVGKIHYYEVHEIEHFIKWLQRPPMMKSRKDAYQHGLQAYMIWSFISNDRKVSEIIDTDKLNEWMFEFLKGHAPGTARSYLSSYSMFISHLINFGHLKKNISKALHFKEDIKLLSKTIQKKVRRRRVVKEVEDLGKIFHHRKYTHNTYNLCYL